MRKIYNAKDNDGLQLPVEFENEKYIPTEDAYPAHASSTHDFMAMAYKTIADNGNHVYEVEVDQNGDPVEYTVFWNELEDYDPEELELDSACDWDSPADVIKR